MMEIVKNAYIPESATSPRQLNRAKRHILVGEAGAFAASFSKLPAFCTMFEKLNPGSQASVEVDLDNNFESMFFGFRSCVDVMKSVGLPVFAIDGCRVLSHSRCSWFDASSWSPSRLVPLAFARQLATRHEAHTRVHHVL